MKKLCLILLFLAIAVSASGRTKTPKYRLTGLGFLPGGTVSVAYGINEWGDVVGFAQDPGGMGNLPVIFPIDSSLIAIPLPNGIAYDINNFREVVGSWGYDEHAFYWTENLGTIDLGPGVAVALNDKGYTAGQSFSKMCIWKKPLFNQTPVYLSTLNSVALDINKWGDVVGSIEEGYFSKAWSSKDGFLDVGGYSSYATGITSKGVVCGFTEGDEQGQNQVAFVKKKRQLLASSQGVALAINDKNTVIGSNDQGPFILSKKHGLRQLNDLLDESAQGWRLVSVLDINQSGAIAGTGLNPEGKMEAVRLTPSWDNLDADQE